MLLTHSTLIHSIAMPYIRHVVEGSLRCLSLLTLCMHSMHWTVSLFIRQMYRSNILSKCIVALIDCSTPNL